MLQHFIETNSISVVLYYFNVQSTVRVHLLNFEYPNLKLGIYEREILMLFLF